MLKRPEISLQRKGANTGHGTRAVKRFPLHGKEAAILRDPTEQAQVPHEH
jgi:hypothetical protein